MEKTLKIYENYGVLSAEYRSVYTYGNPHATANTWDTLTVQIPDGWDMYENNYGEPIITAPWGEQLHSQRAAHGRQRAGVLRRGQRQQATPRCVKDCKLLDAYRLFGGGFLLPSTAAQDRPGTRRPCPSFTPSQIKPHSPAQTATAAPAPGTAAQSERGLFAAPSQQPQEATYSRFCGG